MGTTDIEVYRYASLCKSVQCSNKDDVVELLEYSVIHYTFNKITINNIRITLITFTNFSTSWKSWMKRKKYVYNDCS